MPYAALCPMDDCGAIRPCCIFDLAGNFLGTHAARMIMQAVSVHLSLLLSRDDSIG
jgi:hypothetical protein